ncbi:Cytochrome c oxidase assembly protein cox15 [Knufia fluminis]|uniref:Cytochrome c oxidase assembly protein cox15 n=1 Tax=Knufia fluminis TaxID=191047 RepID=A0AAN8I346_9EURO|nr:Cytochrome c oxidase assembly protein cox15 [Knufia fluminis]
MFATASFRHALREAAPNLSRRYFSCQARSVAPSSRHCISSNAKRLYTQDFKNARAQYRLASTSCQRGFRTSARLREAIAQAETAVKKSGSRFPETSSNAVAYWLLASAASVFGIVVFGGLTRLTESGLSITEWKPVTGSLPPMSHADWSHEFAKYRASPEFLILNSQMTLEEFKSIYWMEWIHRIWGRFVGLSFVLPAAYFIATKRVSKNMVPKLGGIAALIGFQGFLGWWMVKSGLKDDFLSADRRPGRDVPRVSQYRLAAHLGTAFVAYLSMLWCGLDILRTNKIVHGQGEKAAGTLYMLRNPALRPFKIAVAALLGLTFTTAMSGALVAGLDAGLIYNEFPYMGLGLTPPVKELFDPFYSHDASGANRDLVWRNMLENPSLVQLDHRILATTTFVAVHALWAWTRYSRTLREYLPRAAKKGVHGVVGFVWLQVILGISTLIYMVPIPLASAHQAGALALLTWTTVLGSRIWFPKVAAEVLRKRAGQAMGQKTSYSFPGIEKVKPNYGQGQAVPVMQASIGTAAATALGSMFLAGKVQEQKDEKRREERLILREDQMELLRRQQRGMAVPVVGSC